MLYLYLYQDDFNSPAVIRSGQYFRLSETDINNRQIQEVYYLDKNMANFLAANI